MPSWGGGIGMPFQETFKFGFSEIVISVKCIANKVGVGLSPTHPQCCFWEATSPSARPPSCFLLYSGLVAWFGCHALSFIVEPSIAQSFTMKIANVLWINVHIIFNAIVLSGDGNGFGMWSAISLV